MTIVSAENLSVRYRRRGVRFFGEPGGEAAAVEGVSFSLEGGGETLSVIGESGSGKTTLLRSILGLVSPSEGRVTLWGRPMAAMTDAERLETRRRCGYIQQDPYGSLPPALTSLETVLEPWTVVHGRKKRAEGLKRAKGLLDELKLPESLWSARVRRALSGGQRQRLAVARALVLEPELLLCDEPTAMQDVSTRGEVLEVLERRVRAGMSMILVTHDLLLARYAAARALVLHGGKIVEAGASDALLERPAHSYTRALLAALPRLTETAEGNEYSEST
jgi:peptide/nickel transport system ATP-binding protein